MVVMSLVKRLLKLSGCYTADISSYLYSRYPVSMTNSHFNLQFSFIIIEQTYGRLAIAFASLSVAAEVAEVAEPSNSAVCCVHVRRKS